jgi:hypothetical protein
LAYRAVDDPEVAVDSSTLASEAGAGDGLVFESPSGGPVRAVVDGTGRLVGLSLDTRLLHQSRDAVAEAVIAAVTHAQDAAAAHRAPERDAGEGIQQRLAVALDDATWEAERRLSELRVLVSDLARDAERWR